MNFERGQKFEVKADLFVEIAGVAPLGQPVQYAQTDEQILTVNINGVSQQCKSSFVAALLGGKK